MTPRTHRFHGSPTSIKRMRIEAMPYPFAMLSKLAKLGSVGLSRIHMSSDREVSLTFTKQERVELLIVTIIIVNYYTTLKTQMTRLLVAVLHTAWFY